ncbi:hypothetical protein cypCar_00010756 [Cyprinus carpio]|nr:hypothetical protein cypCar_00010756 [Cyprinus carpio]
MEQFGQRLVVLSLCLLAAVIISEQKLQNDLSRDDDICSMYMQGTSRRLNMSEAFDMITLEYGWDTQTLNPMVTQQWMDEVDDDHDKRLNMAECAKLVQRVSDSIQRPPQ